MQTGIASNPPILYAQPGQTNVNVLPVSTSQPSTNKIDRFPKRAGRLLGSIQLTCGILCIIFQSAAIAVDAELAEVGHGIWCSVFFILAGSFGIAAANCKTKCLIVTFMVLSIVAATFAPVVLICSAIGWAEDADECSRGYWDYDKQEWICQKGDDAAIAMNAMLVFISLVEGVAAVLSAVTCCRAYCCCTNKTSSSNQKFLVVYVGNGGDRNPAVINTQSLQSMQLQQPMAQVINAQTLQSMQLQQPIAQVINAQTLQSMQLQQPIAQGVTPVDPNQYVSQAEAPPQYDTLSTEDCTKQPL